MTVKTVPTYTDLQDQVIAAMAGRKTPISAKDLLPLWPAEIVEHTLRELAPTEGFILIDSNPESWCPLGALDIKPWEEVRAFLRACKGFDDYRSLFYYSVDRALNGKQPFSIEELRALPGPDRTEYWLRRQATWARQFQEEVRLTFLRLARVVENMDDFSGSNFAKDIIGNNLSWTRMVKLTEGVPAGTLSPVLFR